MKVTFLGSGDAFGSGGRFQTCILVETSSDKFLLDCGCSSMIAMRKIGVDPNEVSIIFLTHLHGDHFGGVPFFLLDAQMISKRTSPLTIVGPIGAKERIICAMEVMFPGSSKVQQKFNWDIIEIDTGTAQSFVGVDITTYPMVHPSGNTSTAVRIQCEGKTIAYTGDTEWNDAIIDAAQDADLLIAEAYFFERQVKFHLDYKTIMEHLPELGVKKVVLTHMGNDMLGRLTEVSCEAAHDGKVIEI